jgi:hypothetical protein
LIDAITQKLNILYEETERKKKYFKKDFEKKTKPWKKLVLTLLKLQKQLKLHIINYKALPNKIIKKVNTLKFQLNIDIQVLNEKENPVKLLNNCQNSIQNLRIKINKEYQTKNREQIIKKLKRL